MIGASRSESLEIVCEVDADPPADSFRWKFNNSGETLEVGPERFTHNGSVSVLKYTPVADLDYGTLSCWAQNSIGMQMMPCVYQLVAAGEYFHVYSKEKAASQKSKLSCITLVGLSQKLSVT